MESTVIKFGRAPRVDKSVVVKVGGDLKYHLKTFGCSFNYSDSERVSSLLEDVGYTETANEEEADFIIFNTCAIRQKAEDKVFGLFPRMLELKEGNNRLKVAVTGCMVRKTSSNLTPKKDRLVADYEAIDITFRIDELQQLPEMLRALNPETVLGEPAEEFDAGTIKNYFAINPKYTSKFQAFVPIAHGCDKFCAFCIVPFSRGREKSRSMQDILDECEKLVSRGCKEITLLGQTVDSYGLSFDDRASGRFAPLQTQQMRAQSASAGRGEESGFAGSEDDQIELELNKERSDQVEFELNKEQSDAVKPKILDTQGYAVKPKIFDAHRGRELYKEKPKIYFTLLLEELDRMRAKGLRRVRWSSPHPKDLTDDLVEAVATLETQMPYIHLPVQAGSTAMLKRMNRPYTRERYIDRIAKIRELIPDCAISTDIIVGFCGETEEMFEESVSMYEQVRWDMAFLSQYSMRKFTAAYRTMKDDVSSKIKSARWHKLNEILKVCSREKMESFVGKTVEILVERVVEDGRLEGRSEHFKRTQFVGDEKLIGEIVQVKIERAEDFHLEGKINN